MKKKQNRNSKPRCSPPIKTKLIYDFWVPVKIIVVFLMLSAVVSLVVMCGYRE